MNLNKLFAEELQQESATTRKMIERVPPEKFDWKPHEKSTTLGGLAGHIAQLPFFVSVVLTQDELDFDPKTFTPFVPQSVSELLENFDQKVAAAIDVLNSDSGEKLQDVWRLRSGEQIFLEMPKAAMLRWAMSHIIHHRGQLSVYLRLLDVPLPPVYGPTADEQGS